MQEEVVKNQVIPGNEVFEKNKVKRWLLLAYGVLMMMSVGVCYAWSILNGPISTAFGELWDEALGGMVFTIFIYCNATCGVISGIVIGKLKTVRYNILISAVLMCLSFVLTAFAKDFWLLFIGFSVLGGIGSAFTYNGVIVNLTKWFPDRIGVSTGSLLMGFGIGSFVIGNVYSALVSAFGWNMAFVIMGVSIGVILLLGVWLMKEPPQDYVAPVRPPKVDKFPVEGIECTPMEMVKRPSFWYLFIGGCFGFIPGAIVSVFGRQLVLTIDPSMLPYIALIVGAVPVANGIGRIFTGFINDWFGMGFNIRVSALMVFVGSVLVTLSFAMGSLPFLIVSMILLGFGAGMMMPDCAVITRKLFGEKHFQVNFQMAMLAGYINAWSATLFGAMLGLTQGFIIPLILVCVCGLIGTVFTCLIRKP